VSRHDMSRHGMSRHLMARSIFCALALCLALGPVAAHAQEEPSLREQVKTLMEKVEQGLDSWDVPAARRALTELEEIIPGGMEPLKYFHGRLAFEEGRYDDAVKFLTEAKVEDKPSSYLRLAKDTQAILRGHLRTESEHFIFIYPPGKDEILVPYAMETLESIYRAMVEDLGWVPQGKIRVEVVNNARDLSRTSTLSYEQIRTTGTIAICKFNKIIVTSPKAVARGYDWQDTLAHEYVHLVVSQMSSNAVPIWLHEGLAKYLESRWRGQGGLSMTPSTQALLGKRVKADTLVPFEKMSPSIAMLPTAEDAALAFAEVYYAIDYIQQTKGTKGLRTIVQEMRNGLSDKKAVEAATGMPFALFEKAWLAHIKKQPFPKELLPPEKVVLQEDAKEKDPLKKGREISFGDFMEVQEVPARKYAHLGELLRERNRIKAASEEYAKAHRIVGDKYESVSNKYALTLLELKRLEEAEQVLRGSLRMHPGSPTTNVHLGRILLFRKQYEKSKVAYLEALGTNPFDPEIHVALMRIHNNLGESALASRARDAAIALTGVKGSDIIQMSGDFLRQERELADINIPSADDPPAAATEPAKDGGK